MQTKAVKNPQLLGFARCALCSSENILSDRGISASDERRLAKFRLNGLVVFAVSL